MAAEPMDYWDYLQLEPLLTLQGGTERDEAQLDNHEVMFIVVHQIDELWFKLAIRELVAVRTLLSRNPVPEQSLASAVRGLRRLALLFQQVTSHFALMETMTTRDYLGFRHKLNRASGFQSAQLREIEYLFGLDDSARSALDGATAYLDALRRSDGAPSPALARVERRRQDGLTLRDVLDDWLYRTPIQGSRPEDEGDGAAVARFIDDFCRAHAAEQRGRLRRVLELIPAAERAPLEQRYERERIQARSYLEASDAAPAERARRSRIRAALVFIESYRELPLLSWPRELLDSVVACEQAFTLFRHRHARMVERMIGRRTGTGGSSGVDYLDSTAAYRVFHDLWAVRTLLLPQAALPPLAREELYGFVAD
jgi:tryptophan 2,3-dioxygenase